MPKLGERHNQESKNKMRRAREARSRQKHFQEVFCSHNRYRGVFEGGVNKAGELVFTGVKMKITCAKCGMPWILLVPEGAKRKIEGSISNPIRVIESNDTLLSGSGGQP